MNDEQYIIDALDISGLPEDKRESIIAEASVRIGNAIIDAVSEEDYSEYKQIVDDNHEVIDAWLEKNVPGYKESAVYKEIAAGYEDDPEKNNPNKLFATVAWVQLNVPQLQQLVDTALEEYQRELLSRG